MDKENKLILYKDEEGRVSVNTRFADEDVWLTQAQLVEIYQSSKSNISEHLTNIFADKELDKEVVVRKFRTTTPHGAIEGKTQTHTVLHYNLDVIIALGYRVQSSIAVRFRRWATQRLHEYIQKGFTMDDERLKQGGNRYFRELLQRIYPRCPRLGQIFRIYHNCEPPIITAAAADRSTSESYPLCSPCASV